MATEDSAQQPAEPQPLVPDTASPQEPPPDPAATCNVDQWDEPDFHDEPPDEISIHDEPATGEGKWRETPYDSFEDTRHNVSHVGDPDTDYEYVFEPDDHQPMSGESVRRRGTDEWSDHGSLY